jgi:S1-C subfamily serine protease
LAHELGRARALEVVQLLEGSPAAAAVSEPAIILELDGRAIEGVADLQRLLDDQIVGRQVPSASPATAARSSSDLRRWSWA